MLVWRATQETQELVDKIKNKYHNPRLEEAKIAVSFNDAKPFLKGRFNWGKTSKFSPFTKIWQDHPYDFHISLPADGWHSVLNASQREAWLDLHLCRCQVEYEPETVEQNGKKKTVKDDWGRTKYTNVIKRDEEGRPRFKLDPLDLVVIQQNIASFGAWCPIMMDVKQVINKESATL